MKSKDALIVLVLGVLPTLSFGQGFELPTAPDSTPALSAPVSSPVPPSVSPPVSPPVSSLAAPAPLESFTPINAPITSSSAVADQSPTLPITPTSLKTSQEPTAKQIQERPDLLRSMPAADHPFYNHFNAPNDSKSPIQGKPYAVAQLLSGVREPSTRRQLLTTYWELAGLLAEWNIRLDAERRVLAWHNDANTARNTQRADGFIGACYLAQQQRKATEIAFAKKQYQLVELLRSLRGVALAVTDYPIPCDYPIAKNYVTYVDKIARSERTRYVGRIISYQFDLVEAKKMGRHATERSFATMTQNPQSSPQEWVAALNQRTDAHIDLVADVVDYNKLIAEYTADTVGSNVSGYRLLAAVLELPKTDRGQPTEAPSSQLATPPPPKTFSQLDDRSPPPTFAPGESAYSRPADAEPPPNLFADVKAQPIPPSRSAPVVAETNSSPPPNPFPDVQPTTTPDGATNPIQPASYVEEK